MIAYLALGIAILLSLVLFARWVAAADPRAVVKGVRYGGGAAAICLALYILVSGRWPVALAALTAGLPFFLRWRLARERMRAATGPSSGKRSDVETAMLVMSLDHETGEILGTVRQGSMAGRALDSLSRGELVSLLEECQAEDPQSVPLLESYLDR